MRAAGLIAALAVAAPVSGCASAQIARLALSPECLGSPALSAAGSFRFVLDVTREGTHVDVGGNGGGTRSCVGQPRTINEGIARAIGGLVPRPNPPAQTPIPPVPAARRR